MVAPAPASVAPTSMLKEPASEARTAGKRGAGPNLAKSSDKDAKAPVCSVNLIPGKRQSLGDSKALLAVIRRVAEQQGCAQTKPGSSLRLRITVDGAGKIVKAERLDGDETLATAIINKLTGESSATTAKAAPEGTLEVRINF